MKSTSLIFHVGKKTPEIAEHTEKLSLQFLQETVGGYIEAVPSFETIAWEGSLHRCVAFCNEEGKIQNPPLLVNYWATSHWNDALRRKGQSLIGPDGRMLDVLCGTIIVLFGDDAFWSSMIDDEENNEDAEI